MTEQKSDEIKSIVVTEAVKKRWVLAPEEDYPMLMAEYARLTLDEVRKTTNEMKGIYAGIRAMQQGLTLLILISIVTAAVTGCYIIGF